MKKFENIQLLKDLYYIWSGSRCESKMIRFITDYIRWNYPDAIISVDEIGNIYVTKGIAERYPCFVAHTDQVQNKYPKDYKVLIHNGIIYSYSKRNRCYCGLGADDKNGIYCALMALGELDCCKAAFFVSEEIGCVGSDKADMQFFDDCYVVLQADRRGRSDLITNACGIDLCSEEFINAITPIFKARNYKEANGSLTDVYTLKENGLNVCCLNISCGYYEPHTEFEHTNLNDLYNCYHLMIEIAKASENIDTQHCNEYYKWNYDVDIDWDSKYFDTYDMLYDIIVDEIYAGMQRDEIISHIKDEYPYILDSDIEFVYADVMSTIIQ